MKHLTLVYEIPDGTRVDELTSHENMIACSWCDAIALKKELLAALLYVQERIESGHEIAMSQINEAIRSAQQLTAPGRVPSLHMCPDCGGSELLCPHGTATIPLYRSAQA